MTLPEFPEVKEIILGGCIEGIKKKGILARFRRRAHSHCSDKDEYKGTICVLSAKEERIRNPVTGKLTMLALHEIAHILTGHGHDAVFFRKVREIGGAISKYEKSRSKVSYSKL